MWLCVSSARLAEGTPAWEGRLSRRAWLWPRSVGTLWLAGGALAGAGKALTKRAPHRNPEGHWAQSPWAKFGFSKCFPPSRHQWASRPGVPESGPDARRGDLGCKWDHTRRGLIPQWVSEAPWAAITSDLERRPFPQIPATQTPELASTQLVGSPCVFVYKYLYSSLPLQHSESKAPNREDEMCALKAKGS